MPNIEADLLARVAGLIDRLETLLPAPAATPDWKTAIAYRWRTQNGRGYLKPVAHPHRIRLADLRGVARDTWTGVGLGDFFLLVDATQICQTNPERMRYRLEKTSTILSAPAVSDGGFPIRRSSRCGQQHFEAIN